MSSSDPQSEQNINASAGLAASVENHLRAYFDAHETEMPAAGLYNLILREIERPLFELTLDQCRGNQLRAAEILGLNRNTLRKKIQELGICSGRKRRLMMGSGA